MKYYLWLLLVFIAIFGESGICQTTTNYDIKENLLAQPDGFVNCGLALRFIDDSLDRAYTSKSSFIAIVRMRLTSNTASLARSRMDNLERYIRFRGFTHFQLAAGVNSGKSDQIELYVQGELLYSLSIKKNDKFDLAACVAPKIKLPRK
jgi:hypothetical protein